LQISTPTSPRAFVARTQENPFIHGSQMMFPTTSERVPASTADALNQRIRQDMEARVAAYKHATPATITRRLEELDQEWDTERVLEANASTLIFTGCVLAAATHRRWLILPIAVSGFLFQHAVQGWCPPLPAIRALGIRTQAEIDQERFALKALRGDFDRTCEVNEDASQVALDSVRS
jgi:hypothetical protein